ncbi:MAG: hypothetical protein ACXWGX_17555, partial [Usitatibacter sp.]
MPWMLRPALLSFCLLAANAFAALDPATVARLAFGEGDEKVAAVAALVASDDAQAMVLLKALADGDGARLAVGQGMRLDGPG